jgi:hypothetical protein
MAKSITIAYIIDTGWSEADYNRKMHIPDDPHFAKNSISHPGDLVSKQQQRKGK